MQGVFASYQPDAGFLRWLPFFDRQRSLLFRLAAMFPPPSTPSSFFYQSFIHGESIARSAVLHKL